MSVLPVSVSPTERRRAREFAGLLDDPRTAEGHELAALVALAATLRPAPLLEARTAPRADFRAALRERLVTAAAERTQAPIIPAQQSVGRPAPPRRRVRRLVATGVTVGLVAGAGAAVASSRALPGDSLYGLKRGIESAQLHLAGSDLSRGRELLDQAGHRLSEVEALAASSTVGSTATRDRIATALTEMDAETRAGAEELSAAYAATGDDEALVLLDRFVVDQRARLLDLGALLHGDLRRQVQDSAALLARLQTQVDALLAGIGGVPKAVDLSRGTEQVHAIARESGDGWAVSRLLAQLDSAADGSTLAAPGSEPAGGSGTGGGLITDLGAGVDDALSGLTGTGTSGGNAAGGSTGTGAGGSDGSSSATGPSTAGGGLGQAGTATVPTIPSAPTPVVTVPAPGGGSTPIATLPQPSITPPSVTPPVSLPSAPVTTPAVQTPAATLPVCPPLTTC